MRRLLVLALALCLLTTFLPAAEETKAIRRVESAATVLDEIQGAPDQGIPQEVLGSAECVAVIPTLLKGGFIFGGRYGKGQVLLLENSGLLLVSAEDGRVVLLRADPGEHAEVASFAALEGKTWNHPVVVGDRLYVRNAQEAACYKLPLAEAKTTAARL